MSLGSSIMRNVRPIARLWPMRVKSRPSSGEVEDAREAYVELAVTSFSAAYMASG